MKVLILGADGFIGRHIAFGLRAEGAEVIACARRPEALREMGFEVLAADLSDPATHEPGFWRAALAGGVHLVNCAGLLTGSDEAFEAVVEGAGTLSESVAGLRELLGQFKIAKEQPGGKQELRALPPASRRG